MTKPKAQPADFWRDAYQVAKDIHEIEVRLLRDQLAEARARVGIDPRQWQGVASEEEEDNLGGGKEENPLRKSNPTQWIMDSLEEQIPLSNDQARNTLRSWVDRQLRLRGQGSIDEILAEAVQGDVTDEHDEEEVEP